TAMAEFLLRHARWIAEATRETPLEALRAGDLERARSLVDLHDPELRVLWALLLAWELKERGNPGEALEPLRDTPLRLLSGWRGTCAALLLPCVEDLDPKLSARLREGLLFYGDTASFEDIEHLELLVERLAEMGYFQAAEDATRPMFPSRRYRG